MLNKKADIETVKKLIIALIIILVLFFAFTYLGDILYGTGSKAACQNWVYRNSVTGIKEAIGDESSSCITTQETIKTTSDNEIYEQLAKNMYDCWDQYGRGESDFYSDFDFGQADTYCRICSEIKIDESIKNKKIDVDKFEVYLSSHNPPNHKETYSDFFTKSANSKLDLGSNSLDLTSEKNLYTTFLVYKRSSGLTAETVAFTLGGCYVGAQIGTAFAPVIPVTATTGCAMGMISVLFTKATSIGDILYPSIVIFDSNSDNIAKACKYVYYNPEKKPLDILKK